MFLGSYHGNRNVHVGATNWYPKLYKDGGRSQKKTFFIPSKSEENTRGKTAEKERRQDHVLDSFWELTNAAEHKEVPVPQRFPRGHKVSCYLVRNPVSASKIPSESTGIILIALTIKKVRYVKDFFGSCYILFIDVKKKTNKQKTVMDLHKLVRRSGSSLGYCRLSTKQESATFNT